MALSISRRDFLKASSALGLAATVNPVSAASATSAKKKVVIATDKSTVDSSGKPNTSKIQELVDHAIMTLSGKTDKGAAYEALFPAKVTTSTKILLKRNDASGTGTVNTAVVNSLKTGLTAMLSGSFPSANITIRCAGGSAKADTSAATYIINCPVCWIHADDYGVTLSLKNTMTYLNAASVYHSANKAWLYNVSLDPAIKPKQVLSFMDALVGNQQSGPGTSPTFVAGSLIVSSDLVAVDYNALRIIEKQTNANKTYIATGDSHLKSAESAGLGTCTPGNMDIIAISPPWTTGVYGESESLMQSMNIQVHNASNNVDFIIPRAALEPVDVVVFDMAGNVVWKVRDVSAQVVSWNKTSLYGSPLPTGMYAYTIFCKSAKIRGVLMMMKK